MRALRVLAVLVTALMPAWSEQDWRFAQPNADLLIGVDCRRILSSPLAETLRTRLKEAGLADRRTFDVVNGLDQIIVSGISRTVGKKTSVQPVVVLRGNFPLPALRELATSSGLVARPYRSVDLMVQKKAAGKPLNVAFVDAQTVLLGDEVDLRAAIDRAVAGPSLEGNPLFKRAAEMALTHDAWIVGSVSPAALSGEAMPPFAASAAEIRSFSAGLSLRDGMDLLVNLHMRRDESAQQFVAGVRGLMGMVLAQQEEKIREAVIWKKLELDAHGPTVKIALVLDAKELEVTARDIESSITSPAKVRPVATVHAAATTPTQPLQPQAPRVIRVHGMEGGTKVIPYQP